MVDNCRNRIQRLLDKRISELMYQYFLTGRSHADRPRETWTNHLPRRWNKPRNGLYCIATAAVVDRYEGKECESTSKCPSPATVLR